MPDQKNSTQKSIVSAIKKAINPLCKRMDQLGNNQQNIIKNQEKTDERLGKVEKNQENIIVLMNDTREIVKNNQELLKDTHSEVLKNRAVFLEHEASTVI